MKLLHIFATPSSASVA